MFSKKKNTSKLETDQRELYEFARRRTVQKRRLFQHFVIFLVGAVLLIILNVLIGYRQDFTPLGYDWFVLVILIWTFFLLVHLINVFVTDSFMGKKWEQRQLEKLVRKQKDRIAELQKQVDLNYPLPPNNDKKTSSDILEENDLGITNMPIND
jgi:uncharacterized protein YhhL (DUF1145 family)